MTIIVTPNIEFLLFKESSPKNFVIFESFSSFNEMFLFGTNLKELAKSKSN